MRIEREMLAMSAAGESRVRSQSSKRQLRLTAADAHAYSARSARTITASSLRAPCR
jgi:hypothetical protein